MNIAIILAGGSSLRMQGGGLPKQYIEIGGKPIIAYTAEHFQREPAIDRIYIAAKPDYYPLLKSICERYGLDKVCGFLESGEKRHDTVYNCLEALAGVCTGEDIVVTTSAVTPILEQGLIHRTILAAARSGAAVATMPLRNTMIRMDEAGGILDVPDRSRLRVITEPHAYRYGIIRAAYDAAYTADRIDDSVTDDVQILHMAGAGQALVEGNTDFIKITYPNDLHVFERYLLGKD